MLFESFNVKYPKKGARHATGDDSESGAPRHELVRFQWFRLGPLISIIACDAETGPQKKSEMANGRLFADNYAIKMSSCLRELHKFIPLLTQRQQ